MMKKIIGITTILLFSILTLVAFPTKTKATTLSDLRSELGALQAKAAAQQNKKNLTKSQMIKKRQEISETNNRIVDGRRKIEKAKKDIKALNIKIKEKDKEIKELMRFEQIANGDNAYLEYLFGAKDFTDFIYRAAVVEQLGTYNKENIKEMNKLIEENKKLQEELKKKEVELKELNKKLEKDYDALGANLSKLEETALDINDQVKAQRDIISMYVKIGCKENQDITTCSDVPLSSGFNHPLHGKGYITSNYGYRGSPCSGCSSYHRGVDISYSGIAGASVYASTTGRVATIIRRASCGGNQVYINHTVKGKNYLTVYKHLASVNTSVGKLVTAATRIGTVGGGRNTPWDYCSTGPHLHFETAYGHYKTNYYYNTFNPRSVINF